jgi:hypothetical protein
LRRLLRFLREWLRLLAWGDQWGDRIARWLVGLGLVAGGVLLGGAQAWFYLELTPTLAVRATPPREVLVLTVVFAIWALLTVGAAWSRSRGPELWVADNLEEDPPHAVFRLRVGLRGRGVARPAVFVERVVDEQGTDALPIAQMPIELHWSHHDRNIRPEVSKHHRPTVGVAFGYEGASGYMGGVRVADIMLQVHGMAYRPEVWTVQQSGSSRRIAFKISVAIPGTPEVVSRWFGFTPDPTAPIRHRATPLNADRKGNVTWE